MKIKTSITLSEDLLDAINRQSEAFKNRSDFIEAAVRAYFDTKERDTRNAKDLSIIKPSGRYSEQGSRRCARLSRTIRWVKYVNIPLKYSISLSDMARIPAIG